MGEYENVTLDMIYRKLQSIETDVREINEDLHEVKPEFAERLRKIEKGRFHVFKTTEEMEEQLDKMSK